MDIFLKINVKIEKIFSNRWIRKAFSLKIFICTSNYPRFLGIAVSERRNACRLQALAACSNSFIVWGRLVIPFIGQILVVNEPEAFQIHGMPVDFIVHRHRLARKILQILDPRLIRQVLQILKPCITVLVALVIKISGWSPEANFAFNEAP